MRNGRNDQKEITQDVADGKKAGEASELEKKLKAVSGEDDVAEKATDVQECKTEGRKRKCNSEIKVSEQYNEDGADIIIISSDEVESKIHSLVLTRASSVFKYMLSIAKSNSQRDSIDLTDQFVEMSSVVKAVLDVLYDQEVVSFEDDKLYHHVIEFARKYDMAIILKTISKEIRIHAISPEKGFVLRLFRLAIDLGEHELLTAIVRARGSQTWGRLSEDASNTTIAKDGTGTGIEDPSWVFPTKTLTLPEPTVTGWLNQHVMGAKTFDLGGWSYASFAALPTPLAWAILRANLTAGRLS